MGPGGPLADVKTAFRIQELFKAIDANKDGILSVREVNEFIKSINAIDASNAATAMDSADVQMHLTATEMVLTKANW